jgi:hypothetical protein
LNAKTTDEAKPVSVTNQPDRGDQLHPLLQRYSFKEKLNQAQVLIKKVMMTEEEKNQKRQLFVTWPLTLLVLGA